MFYLRVGKTYSVVKLHMRRIDSAEGLFHSYLDVLLTNLL
jgi:type VI protein secretion system component Hcp